MGKLIDLKGKVFGRLTVISPAKKDRQGYQLWLCLCQCSNYKTIRGCNLTNGSTQSCGCMRSKYFDESTERVTHYHDGSEEEIIICRTFPTDMKRRLESLSRLRSTSMQDTIKFALMQFIETQERQQWFISATTPVYIDDPEDT